MRNGTQSPVHFSWARQLSDGWTDNSQRSLGIFLCDLPKDDWSRKTLRLNEQSDKQDRKELIQTQNTHIYIVNIIMGFWFLVLYIREAFVFPQTND